MTCKHVSLNWNFFFGVKLCALTKIQQVIGLVFNMGYLVEPSKIKCFVRLGFLYKVITKLVIR